MTTYGIVIPVYNAGQHLAELLNRIAALQRSDVAVLIVDDGSDPRLPAITVAELPVVIIRHPQNLGKGAALRSGFRHFLQNADIQAVITVDADLQHPPEHIPEFIDAFEAGRGGLIVGMRRRDPRVMPVHRIASNALTTAIISRMIHQPAYDSQCGFRLYSRSVLETIHPAENRFHFESECLLRSGWAGFRIAPVPIPTIYNGAPSAIRNLPDTLNFISLIFKLSLERMRGHV